MLSFRDLWKTFVKAVDEAVDGDDVADVGLGAVRRVKIVAGLDQLPQLGGQGGELTLAGPDVGELLLKQERDVGAWRLTSIPKSEDLRYLGQRETGGLGCADKLQPADDGVVVGPVPVGRPGWSRQQALAFVETDGLTVDAGNRSDFSDEHAPSLRLDLVAHFKV